MFVTPDTDTILIGWGGTYGHLLTAAAELNASGRKVAFWQFRFINPLPENAIECLSKYKMHMPGKEIKRINKIEGQPFLVKEIIDGVIKHMEN